MSDLSGKYKVYLGGRERGLRYTVEDRQRVEDMFPRPDGTPNPLPDLMENHLVGTGAFAVQAAILWAGLHRVDSRIQLGKVKEWLQKESEHGNFGPLFRPVFNAVFESGVLGVTIVDAVTDVPEGEDEEEGPPKEKGGSPAKT